jgi:hypothetical protein
MRLFEHSPQHSIPHRRPAETTRNTENLSKTRKQIISPSRLSPKMKIATYNDVFGESVKSAASTASNPVIDLTKHSKLKKINKHQITPLSSLTLTMCSVKVQPNVVDVENIEKDVIPAGDFFKFATGCNERYFRRSRFDWQSDWHIASSDRQFHEPLQAPL